LILQEQSEKSREILQDTARSREQIRQRRQALEAELRKLGNADAVVLEAPRRMKALQEEERGWVKGNRCEVQPMFIRAADEALALYLKGRRSTKMWNASAWPIRGKGSPGMWIPKAPST